MSNFMDKKISDLLNGKPLWVWWIVYLVITAGIFGIFNLINYLLGIIPFVGVLVLIAAGLLWGYIAFSHNKNKGESPRDDSEGESTE